MYIHEYCLEIKSSIEFFGDDYQEFCRNSHYRNDISMCLMQIGEFAKKLSEDFRKQTENEIPWSQIKGMRNLFAHVYPTMNVSEIFSTAHDCIPSLEEFCKRYIGQISLAEQTEYDAGANDDEENSPEI